MTAKEIEVQLALGSLSINDKEELADNSSTPKKILTILSTDEGWGVRYFVAFNPNTPIDILIELSTDENEYVRSCAVNTLKEK